MARVLVVCSGNTCRSPVAAAWLHKRLQEQGAVDWRVRSAGTAAVPDQLAADWSVRLLAERGIDLSQHRARPLDAELLNWADHVWCMEQQQVAALCRRFPHACANVTTLTNAAGEQGNVPDPYGGAEAEYRQMVTYVTRLVDAALTRHEKG